MVQFRKLLRLDQGSSIQGESGLGDLVNRKITKILFVKSGCKIFDLIIGSDLLIQMVNYQIISRELLSQFVG